MVWSTFGDFWFDDEWSRSAGRMVRRLQDEVNRLFEDVPSGGTGFPPVNLWASDSEVIVMAEVPGIDPKELDLSVLGNVLTMSGERKPEEIGERDRFVRRERGYGQFTRTVELPYLVKGDSIEASCSNGLLRVVLPRAEADKPKRITVASS